MKNKLSWIACAAAACGLAATTTTQAGLFFWDNGNADGVFNNAANWNPDGIPGAADLAVANNGALSSILINGNWSVDSLRFSDGGSATQDSGVLTIASGVGPDNGLWVGEFGPGTVTYNLNGGTIILEDAQDAFDVGRANGSVGIFNMTGGSVTNKGVGNAFFVGRFSASYGRVNLSNGVLNGPAGDTHIGLDGAADWFQSGGTFNSGAVQIGRFASPFATVNLSGTAVWNVGLVLLADGHEVFAPRNSSPVDLKLVGHEVSFNCTGLILKKEANLTFDANGINVSTMHLAGGNLHIDDAEIFPMNLPAPSATGEVLVLIDQIGSLTGPDTQFINAPQGTIFDVGTFDWQIQYRSTNIVLVSVPDCVAPSVGLPPASQQVIVSNAVTFSVGAGGSSPQFQWQFNGNNIDGANSSSFNIPETQYSDAGDYRVIVTTPCSGLSVTSAVAHLQILAPHTFYTWDDASGDHLFSNTNNWNPDGLPYVQDFAGVFITNLFILNADFSVDTLRTGAGAKVLHTNGTLTIVNGIYGDNGLFAGEFGGDCGYTLNGGTIVIKDPADGFMVARNGDSVATFDFLSGTITNTVGDTHIGLDGIATWNQSGGLFKGAGVQIGRFANSAAVHTTLSGNATWDVGLVLLADGHAAFNPRNTNDVFLTLTGPNISFKSKGLVMMNEGKLTFDGAGGGISTMDLDGGIFLLNHGQLFLKNLPTVQSNGQEIVLLKNISAYPGDNAQFENAPAGTMFPSADGSSGWKIQYVSSPTNNIVLVGLPPVRIQDVVVNSGDVTLTFTAGSSDTTGSFVLQSASGVNATYTDVSPAAAITEVSPGIFRAVTPVSGSAQFYRLRRQ